MKSSKKKQRRCYVYVLLHMNRIRYIGSTRNPAQRLSVHNRKSRYRFQMLIIGEHATWAEAVAHEHLTIARALVLGIPIANKAHPNRDRKRLERAQAEEPKKLRLRALEGWMSV